MMYHKPTVPRFRIAERICTNRPVSRNISYEHESNCSFIISASNSSINRGKSHVGSKGPSPHPSTPNRSGIQSPKPTLNGTNLISHNSSATSVYESRIQESHYDTVKPLKIAENKKVEVNTKLWRKKGAKGTTAV
ncbi:GSCOCG00002536001-RA-CDS [Cotesia congregata]|nr:GSCOCG00002536001-RA-CDS [Cotesia congregata]